MSFSRMHSYWASLVTVFLFALAMGYIEATVVVYLRELHYPEGFSFPQKLIPHRYLVIELFREISTVIMLVTVAILAGKKFWERFGYFIIMFGIWDIFYYIWLKVILDWPSSLFEWDILFLIPLPWIGPVIAPVLVALEMIAIGIVITHSFYRGYTFRPTTHAWILAVVATFVILFSFMSDIEAGLRQGTPESYNYLLLFAGLLLYCLAFLHSYMAALQNMNT